MTCSGDYVHEWTIKLESSSDLYDSDDFQTLLDNIFAGYLELWSVKCSYKDDPGIPPDVKNSHDNHTVVVARSYIGVYNYEIIALPCPPHCGEKGLTTFQDATIKSKERPDTPHRESLVDFDKEISKPIGD